MIKEENVKVVLRQTYASNLSIFMDIVTDLLALIVHDINSIPADPFPILYATH